MGIFWRDGGRVAKVAAHDFAHDFFTVEDLSDPNGRVFVIEGNDDSAEGF